MNLILIFDVDFALLSNCDGDGVAAVRDGQHEFHVAIVSFV